MPKNILQDIVPPEKRSIRNIPVPVRRDRREGDRPPVDSMRGASVPPYNSEMPTQADPLPARPVAPADVPHIYSYEDEVKETSRFNKKGIWAACIVALIVVAFAVLSLFRSAIINVTPSENIVSAESETFNAYTGGASGSGVPYQIVSITKDLGQSVPASGSTEVDTKAQGSIIIYNNFSASPQKLIATTRFQTPEGLIYRITSPVTIPGETTKAGVTTPGSVTASVIADKTGSEYNIGLEDFTIPGFQSDAARYKGFYARSKTVMTGGASGMQASVSSSDLASAHTSLQNAIQNNLTSQIGSDVPAGFVYFPDSLFTTFTTLPQSSSTASSVTVNERGTMTAVIFSEHDLATYLSGVLSPNSSTSPVSIANLQNLPFAIQNKSAFDPAKNTSFSFTIAGNINFVTQIDTATLASELAGKPKSYTQTVVDNTPGILRIQPILKPFWKGSFPTDAKSITINVLPPQTQ